jgi:hypothetical protein
MPALGACYRPAWEEACSVVEHPRRRRSRVTDPVCRFGVPPSAVTTPSGADPTSERRRAVPEPSRRPREPSTGSRTSRARFARATTPFDAWRAVCVRRADAGRSRRSKAGCLEVGRSRDARRRARGRARPARNPERDPRAARSVRAEVPRRRAGPTLRRSAPGARAHGCTSTSVGGRRKSRLGRALLAARAERRRRRASAHARAGRRSGAHGDAASWASVRGLGAWPARFRRGLRRGGRCRAAPRDVGRGAALRCAGRGAPSARRRRRVDRVQSRRRRRAACAATRRADRPNAPGRRARALRRGGPEKGSSPLRRSAR